MSSHESSSSAGTPMQDDSPNASTAATPASSSVVTPFVVKRERSSRKRTWSQAIQAAAAHAGGANEEQQQQQQPATKVKLQHSDASRDDDGAASARSTGGLGFTAASANGSATSTPVKHENGIATNHSPNDEASQSESNATAMEDDALNISFGARMLRKYGHQHGEGLGAHAQGRVEPIEASQQAPRAGLGFEPLLKSQQHKYEEFAVEFEIHPNWYDRSTPQAADVERPADVTDEAVQHAIECVDRWSAVECVPQLDEMPIDEWMRVDRIDASELSDPRFADSSVQADLLACKSQFDKLDYNQFRDARERSNPFESLKGEFFQNRAALKMAEMDAIADKCQFSPHLVNVCPNEVLCATGFAMQPSLCHLMLRSISRLITVDSRHC